jgi:hypothetical protein
VFLIIFKGFLGFSWFFKICQGVLRVFKSCQLFKGFYSFFFRFVKVFKAIQGFTRLLQDFQYFVWVFLWCFKIFKVFQCKFSSILKVFPRVSISNVFLFFFLGNNLIPLLQPSDTFVGRGKQKIAIS